MSLYTGKERSREELAQVTRVKITEHQNIDQLIQDLPYMTNLEYLTVNRCIDEKNEAPFAIAISNLVKLRVLDLQYNNFTGRGSQMINNAVSTFEHIEVIWFQGREGSFGNQMTINNLKALVKATPLSEGSELPKERIGRYTYWKAGILMIQQMCISEMNLDDGAAIILANSFEIMVRMTTLYSYKNGFGPAGARELAMKLPNARALVYFSLAYNHIPEEWDGEWMNQWRRAKGMISVEMNMTGNSSMPSLSLRNLAQVTHVKITEHQDDIDQLIRDLPNMINLESLTLQRCLNDQNAAQFAIAIANLTKLKHIDLQYNNIGERPMARIIAVVRSLENLETF
jgi:hypothetical protein